MTQAKNNFLKTVSRWKEYRVADLVSPQTEPRLANHTAVVLEEVVNENESILLGLKYFEDSEEAEVYKEVMKSFLDDLLIENLSLSLSVKQGERAYPNKLSLKGIDETGLIQRLSDGREELKSRAIRITHRYTTLTEFNGIRTSMSIEDLNSACLYLQLIYDMLPNFLTVEDVLIEDDCVRLLAQFYECEPILNSLQIPDDFDEEEDSEIDLYYNWGYYRCPTAILNEQFARSGVKLEMIEIMLSQAIKAVERNSTPEREKIVEQLIAIKNGTDVPLEWGLKRLDGSSYTGAILASEQPDLLEIIQEN